MLQFLYTQTYEPHVASDMPIETPLEFEVKVRAIGDKYMINSLTAMAEQRFKVLSKTASLSDMMHVAAGMRNNDYGPEPLHRQMLAKVLVRNAARLFANHSEVEPELGEPLGLACEMVKELKRGIATQRIRKCTGPTCTGQWFAAQSVTCPKCRLAGTDLKVDEVWKKMFG